MRLELISLALMIVVLSSQSSIGTSATWCYEGYVSTYNEYRAPKLIKCQDYGLGSACFYKRQYYRYSSYGYNTSYDYISQGCVDYSTCLYWNSTNAYKYNYGDGYNYGYDYGNEYKCCMNDSCNAIPENVLQNVNAPAASTPNPYGQTYTNPFCYYRKTTDGADEGEWGYNQCGGYGQNYSCYYRKSNNTYNSRTEQGSCITQSECLRRKMLPENQAPGVIFECCSGDFCNKIPVNATKTPAPAPSGYNTVKCVTRRYTNGVDEFKPFSYQCTSDIGDTCMTQRIVNGNSVSIIQTCVFNYECSNNRNNNYFYLNGNYENSMFTECCQSDLCNNITTPFTEKPVPKPKKCYVRNGNTQIAFQCYANYGGSNEQSACYSSILRTSVNTTVQQGCTTIDSCLNMRRSGLYNLPATEFNCCQGDLCNYVNDSLIQPPQQPSNQEQGNSSNTPYSTRCYNKYNGYQYYGYGNYYEQPAYVYDCYSFNGYDACYTATVREGLQTRYIQGCVNYTQCNSWFNISSAAGNYSVKYKCCRGDECNFVPGQNETQSSTQSYSSYAPSFRCKAYNSYSYYSYYSPYDTYCYPSSGQTGCYTATFVSQNTSYVYQGCVNYTGCVESQSKNSNSNGFSRNLTCCQGDLCNENQQSSNYFNPTTTSYRLLQCYSGYGLYGPNAGISYCYSYYGQDACFTETIRSGNNVTVYQGCASYSSCQSWQAYYSSQNVSYQCCQGDYCNYYYPYATNNWSSNSYTSSSFWNLFSGSSTNSVTGTTSKLSTSTTKKLSTTTTKKLPTTTTKKKITTTTKRTMVACYLGANVYGQQLANSTISCPLTVSKACALFDVKSSGSVLFRLQSCLNYDECLNFKNNPKITSLRALGYTVTFNCCLTDYCNKAPPQAATSAPSTTSSPSSPSSPEFEYEDPTNPSMAE